MATSSTARPSAALVRDLFALGVMGLSPEGSTCEYTRALAGRAFRTLLDTAKQRGLPSRSRRCLMAAARYRKGQSKGKATASQLRWAKEVSVFLTSEEIRMSTAVLRPQDSVATSHAVTGWRLALAQIFGEPLPALPHIPGRLVLASDVPPAWSPEAIEQ